MRMFRNLLLAGAGVMALAAHAQADTITQVATFGPGPTDYNTAAGTTTYNGAASGSTFQYFNTNLGTLTSITFSSSYGFSSTITVTNTSASTATGNARTQSAAQFDASTSAIQNVLNSMVNNYSDPIDGTAVSFGSSTLTPIAYDQRGTNPSYTLATGQSQTLTSTAATASRGPTTDTNATDLLAFSNAGGGTYTPQFSTLSGLILSQSGGNATATQTTTATGTITIAYNYTPTVTPPTTVPEPASFAVLGAGLLGLGALRRRNRA